MTQLKNIRTIRNLPRHCSVQSALAAALEPARPDQIVLEPVLKGQYLTKVEFLHYLKNVHMDFQLLHMYLPCGQGPTSYKGRIFYTSMIFVHMHFHYFPYSPEPTSYN